MKLPVVLDIGHSIDDFFAGRARRMLPRDRTSRRHDRPGWTPNPRPRGRHVLDAYGRYEVRSPRETAREPKTACTPNFS